MPSFLGHDYITPLTIRNNEPRLLATTNNLRQQSVRTGAQRWELDITFVEGIGSTLYPDMLAHFMDKGLESSFTIAMPQNPHLADTVTLDTDLTPKENKSVGDKTITFTTGLDTDLPTGLFFKFSNHDKVYMTTASASSGDTEIAFAPPLVDSVTAADDTIKIAATVDITVKHTQNNTSYAYSQGMTQRVTMSFIESL